MLPLIPSLIAAILIASGIIIASFYYYENKKLRREILIYSRYIAQYEEKIEALIKQYDIKALSAVKEEVKKEVEKIDEDNKFINDFYTQTKIPKA